MLGFVKNIINRSGDKKDNGFYLQLDETGNVVEPTAAAKPAAPAPTSLEASSDAATTEAPAPEAKTSKKVSVKKPKAETAVKTAEAAPAPAAPKPAAPPTEKNFATKYLVQTNTMSRRRPGANMSGFLEMARQAKVPISK